MKQKQASSKQLYNKKLQLNLKLSGNNFKITYQKMHPQYASYSNKIIINSMTIKPATELSKNVYVYIRLQLIFFCNSCEQSLKKNQLPDCATINHLILEHHQNIWKKINLAVIIPIPKPGKDKTEATNYRPIALTGCICKTMERLINDRLVWFLEANNLISGNQAGFRKNYSTNDHLVRLES